METAVEMATVGTSNSIATTPSLTTQEQQPQPQKRAGRKRKQSETEDDGNNNHEEKRSTINNNMMITATTATTTGGGGEVPRTCKWATCAESFPTLDDLAPHLFKNHLNSRSIVDFHCRWGSCTVTVDGSDALLSHLTNHLGQRLIHGCRWMDCGQRFASFDELTGHLSEEHVGTGRSEYTCDWEKCDRQGKIFTQRQKVMRHIQTHTGRFLFFLFFLFLLYDV